MALRSYFIYPVWILLCFPSGMRTENCSELQKESIIVHQGVHQGLSTSINCDYYKNGSQQIVASLITKYTLCEYKYFNTTWTKQFCKDNIIFSWAPQISFQLLNLQRNNSAFYTCNVINYFPPPTRCLGQKNIFIEVQASPFVSVSCEKGPGGSLTMFCTSEGFYPHELKQVWLRDEKHTTYQNSSVVLNTSDVRWVNRTNTDGTFSVTSYLHLSASLGVYYYCWVNHSTLSHPIIVQISSTKCTETSTSTETSTVLLVTGISCGVIAGIGLILAGYYKFSKKRTYLRSQAEEAPLPEPVSHSTLESLGIYEPVPEVYSTLESHLPVSHTYSTLGTYQSVSEVYSTLGSHQSLSHTDSTVGTYQCVSEVYSTLGSHQPVPCRNNCNGSASHISLSL